MLTVALDATPLLGQRTGIGVAVEGFLRHLAGRPELELSAYGLTLRGWARLRGQVPGDAIEVVGRPAPAGLLLRCWDRWDRPSGSWWTGRPQVVHGTNFVVPPTRRSARLVSVWDLTAVRYPQLCTPTSLRYPALVTRAVRTGAWVHTASAFVAEEVTEHFGVPAERVRVVAPAVGVPSLLRPGRPAGRPYILALGRAEPRKDLPVLVRAFDSMAADHPDLELKLAGPVGWGEDELAASIASAHHRDRIERTGWVPDRVGLVGGATVFAYPSLYEGFGLPPLEAMALGVPVVATRAGAVPEVVGPAALLTDPHDADGLAAALSRLVEDRACRDDLIAAGHARVAGFGGHRTADGLVDAYRSLAAAAQPRR